MPCPACSSSVSHEDVGHEIDGLPLVPLRRPGTASHMWPAKRLFDVVTASVLVVLTAPLMVKRVRSA